VTGERERERGRDEAGGSDLTGGDRAERRRRCHPARDACLRGDEYDETEASGEDAPVRGSVVHYRQ